MQEEITAQCFGRPSVSDTDMNTSQITEMKLMGFLEKRARVGISLSCGYTAVRLVCLVTLFCMITRAPIPSSLSVS